MLNGSAKWFVALWLSATMASALVCQVSLAQSMQCKASTPEFASMEKRRIGLDNGSGHTYRLRVRVADSPWEQSAGFQHICPQIMATSAILFVFDRPKKTQFHMFNVHGDLDIAFINEYMEVVSIQRMEPQQRGDPDAVFYGSDEPVLYALEAPPGFFEQRGLKEGASSLVLY